MVAEQLFDSFNPFQSLNLPIPATLAQQSYYKPVIEANQNSVHILPNQLIQNQPSLAQPVLTCKYE
jgi:hypothetical protein